MPRSTDPRNYGPFYEKLAELMDRGEHEIKIPMSGRLAIYHRNNFYAYINAWKHEAKSIPTNKAIDPAARPRLLEQALRIEDVLRKYLVVIDPEPNPELPNTDLRFILRGMDSRQADYLGHLDALIAASPGLTQDEVKERLSPAAFQAVDPAKLRDKDSPVAHFFDGVKTEVDKDMTDELADEILHSDPVDRTDMSDLITPDNQATPPTSIDYQKEALKAAEKLRDKERE